MEEEDGAAANQAEDLDMIVGVARQIASTANKHRTSSTFQALQESLKEKNCKLNEPLAMQHKMKELRAQRYQELQLPHRHVCDMVAMYLGIEPNEVMDGVIDDASYLDLLQSLLDKTGVKCVLFYYQDGPPYPFDTLSNPLIAESGRSNPAITHAIKRLYVTQGINLPLVERAVAVYKFNNVGLDLKNINDEIYFIQLDMDKGKGNPAAITYDILATLIAPLLKLSKDWGDLPKTENGRVQKLNFEGDFASFVIFLDKTKIDLQGVVTFSYDPDVLKEVIEEQREKSYFNKPLIQQIEATARVWHKIIEKCLVQYRQLRKENEFVGPEVEIEYWRRQLARFTCVVEFLETEPCKHFMEFMEYIGNHKIIKIWRKHVDAAYDTKNECADNVKYLYSMEKYWEPFYRLEPPQLPEYVQPLLHAVRMVFTTSRYYNSTANVTALLVKVSNQIIIKCRNYLNCNGAKTVWNQPKQFVMDKIKTCLDLYLKYYQCFKRTQRQMVAAEEKPFECSEMFIFGKLETFKKRLEEIVFVLSTTMKYSILQSSTIEGIDVYANKFIEFFKKISSQKYDALNHRLPFFDKDYKEFRQNVVDTEWELEEFVGNSLENMTDVDNVLRLLKRFEKLNLECLHLEERYLEAMQMFQCEIEALRDRYNEERQSPTLPRNMPPVSGRIMWIRHFFKRIEQPMEVFKTKSRVMRHRKVQKCIQLFNAMSLVFVQYENIYHNAWYSFAGQVRHCLMAPILYKQEKTRRYTVNFNPYITEVIREAEYMYKLDLAVPDVGQVLVFCKEKILNSYEVVNALVERNDSIRMNIPTLFLPMMRVQLIKMENVFRPGFSTITWTSMKIPEFCQTVSKVLDYIEMFVKEVRDMKEARIDEVLETISQTCLVYLPDEAIEAISPSEFLDFNVRHRQNICMYSLGLVIREFNPSFLPGKEIELKSLTVEKCVIDLINKFLSVIDQPDLQEDKYNWLVPEKVLKPIGSTSKLLMSGDAAFREIDRNVPLDLASIHSDCIEMFSYFNMKIMDALIKCTKMSLEKVKKRAVSMGEGNVQPIMKTNMILQIPIAIITPSLDEIQAQFSHVLNNVLDTHKYISMWGQEGRGTKKAIKVKKDENAESVIKPYNYFKIVSENKEIVRIFMSLQGVMYLVNPDIINLLQKYLEWRFLWAENRDQQIEDFCQTNPLLVEISERFQEYDARSEMIRELPEKHDIGAVQIAMGMFKLALLVESNAWKHILGKKLGLLYKRKLDKMVDFIKTQEKVLSKPIKDLDDCRLAMNCLEVIRENFIEMDMDLGVMEEAYGTFARFNIDVPKEEIERVESLRFNFQNMVTHSKVIQEEICTVQGPLLEELTNGVAKFKDDVAIFDQDFEEKGPMVAGLSAREASDRVLVFQDRFDELWRKFEMYSSGERLFGLEVNDYPVLHKRKKEFNLLNKLYGLYLAVNHSIDGYFDILWSDVDTEVIFAELQEFQNRSLY
ncbi:hypothetical protein NQ315_006264 [Exocentrus adspersus]|uniref:Dynein heavy chain tail domain-containing protein n=1 Tax=Exocentrus adspersus TaxID=1586481 RepID=A0AAV8W1G2_9CUCU|nr:hypothetical protein NQ315_006264 [Exocentrus adspersus]